MYMVKILGYTDVTVFSDDLNKAKENAVKIKKSLCFDDEIKEWTWEKVSEFYGCDIVEIKEGKILVENNDVSEANWVKDIVKHNKLEEVIKERKRYLYR